MTVFELTTAAPSKIFRQTARGIIANLFPSAWLWCASAIMIAYDFMAIHNGHKFLIDSHKLWLIALAPFAALPLAWWLSRGRNVEHSTGRPLRLLMMTAFFIPSMSALAVFDYLVMANNQPFAHEMLSRWDQALGLNWNAYAEFVANHLWLNWSLFQAYKYMVQALVIVIGLAIIQRRNQDANELITLTLFTGLATMCIGSFFPAVGAMTFYANDTLRALYPSELEPTYLQELLEVRGSIPKLIDPTHIEGITQFPSFHTVCGLLTIYGARRAWWSLVPALIFSSLLIAATPIYGSHYFVDLLAGAGIAGIGIWIYRRVFNRNAGSINITL